MATKANPGPHDCYAKAADDEPIFTLRAKDPAAPFVIKLWQSIRAQDYSMVQRILDAAQEAITDTKKTISQEQIDEATNCAKAMIEWRHKHYPSGKN